MGCTGNEICHIVKKFTPSSAPRLWVVINVTILLYSILLLCLLAFTQEGSNWYDTLVMEWYLTYDVIVCLVWLIETSFRMISSIGTDDRTTSSSCNDSAQFRWSKWLVAEWLMALYFVFDSVSRSRNKSSNGQEDETIWMGLDLSINAIAYVYLLYVQYKEHEEKMKQVDSEEPADKQGRSGYQML